MKPVEPQMELRPYLSPERYIANVTDLKKRETVEKNFKYLISNRPRHLLKEETYLWEKIYKVRSFFSNFHVFHHVNNFEILDRSQDSTDGG